MCTVDGEKFTKQHVAYKHLYVARGTSNRKRESVRERQRCCAGRVVAQPSRALTLRGGRWFAWRCRQMLREQKPELFGENGSAKKPMESLVKRRTRESLLNQTADGSESDSMVPRCAQGFVRRTARVCVCAEASDSVCRR